MTSSVAKRSYSARDLLVLVGLFALLIGFAVFAFSRQAEADRTSRAPAYSTHSSEPAGTRALALWLDALGYRTSNLEYSTFSVPQAASMLMIVEPWTQFEPAEVALLIAWVQDGGTLVAATDGGYNSLPAELGATFFMLPQPTAPGARQPFFNRPPLVDPLPPVDAGIKLTQQEAVVH